MPRRSLRGGTGATPRWKPRPRLRQGVDMLINNRWIAIPRGTLQYRMLEGDTGETGGGHWCGEPWEGSFITYCAFLPPTLAAVDQEFGNAPSTLRINDRRHPVWSGPSRRSGDTSSIGAKGFLIGRLDHFTCPRPGRRSDSLDAIDSCCFDDPALANCDSALKRWLMKQERALYKGLPRPDLVLRLTAPIDTTIERD